MPLPSSTPEHEAAQVMETRLTALLGLRTPLIQAPIGRAATPALAAAVSAAGGLGMLAVTWDKPEELERRLAETLASTQRPFGVNFVLAFPPGEKLRICLEAGVRVVSFSWGDATAYLDEVHDRGALAMVGVGDGDEAAAAVAAGADVLVTQGVEAGGHVAGEIGTMALVPTVVDAAPEVPVVAAGGIVDGRGLAAALALGADGALVGTRFLLSEEAAVHPAYRRRLLEAKVTDTVLSELFDLGWPEAPHRTLRNRTIDRWEEAGRPTGEDRPGVGEEVARSAAGRSIPRYHFASPIPELDGDIEYMALYAGQGIGVVTAVRPAAEIVDEMHDEATARIRALAADPRPDEGVTPMAFSVPDLPYAPDALEPTIDAQTMRLHHDKHHQAYVDKANAALAGTEWEGRGVEEVLRNLDSLPEAVRTAVRNNAGGHYNHSLFWQMMSPEGGGEPDGELASAIAATFGSFDAFKDEFKAAATNRFGSGWAWLVAGPDGGLAVTATANQDSPLSEGLIPLLGVDVWEHAYYLTYQNRRPDYLDAFWDVVDWRYVAGRFAGLRTR